MTGRVPDKRSPWLNGGLAAIAIAAAGAAWSGCGGDDETTSADDGSGSVASSNAGGPQPAAAAEARKGDLDDRQAADRRTTEQAGIQPGQQAGHQPAGDEGGRAKPKRRKANCDDHLRLSNAEREKLEMAGIDPQAAKRARKRACAEQPDRSSAVREGQKVPPKAPGTVQSSGQTFTPPPK
ncbi:MAG: hypothetical protein AABM29_06805 [Actinomycetota bacterium]